LYKLAILCPERIEKGFALTGVETFVSNVGSTTQEKLSELLGQKEWGVIILPQEHLDDFDPKMLKKLDSVQIPLIVPVPMGSKDASSPEAYVSQIVRRAIGYQIKI